MIDEEETTEQIIKRYAYNRYQMRMHFNWRLNETSEDDYRIAKEIVEREQKEYLARRQENCDSDKSVDKGFR